MKQTPKEKAIEYLDKTYIEIDGIGKNFRFHIDTAIDIALQELVKERDELAQEVNDLKDNITTICQENKAKIKEMNLDINKMLLIIAYFTKEDTEGKVILDKWKEKYQRGR